MSTVHNSNKVALIGLLIGLLLLALFIGLFSIVSSSGRLRTPPFIENIVTKLSSPAPPPRKHRDEAPAQAQTANPGNRSGLTSASPSGDAAPSGGGGAGGGVSAGPPAKSAAEALQQVLKQYRNDPKHTATVTISSNGRIVQSAPGPLTVHDGLPMDAVNGSTELQGGTQGASGSAAAP